ncbi:hypothetical protein K469DRAFT_245084 [Zopfia rhizophila CBS 207.26]|uniref:Uncharacterized protein n=1 Tax=Zopfia rhizophila CBS 207.26 TaxID=1314779 RepID=A0A6A6DRD6_9PEZI|nr:hypothetical protein K469DRAFT_245084 [Zopfia rhizophila CBS 207.26]
MSDERIDYRHNWFSKKWNLEALKDGKFKENKSHLKWKRGSNAEDDDTHLFLQEFLQDSEDSAPSCIVEEVTQFCQAARLTDLKSGMGPAGQRRVAWLDDRSFSSLESRGSVREYKDRLTATELYQHLKVLRFDNPDRPDAERRLIYIADLDPYYIFALGETAPFRQIEGLRDAFWKHIAFQTSMSVQILPLGFSAFRLELHLPFLALRPSPPHKNRFHKQGYTNPKRRWTDLQFLKVQAPGSQNQRTYRMYEGHITFMICGSDERRWVAYAFVDTAFNESDPEDEEEFPAGTMHEDPIADGKLDAEFPLWNPREYFLMVCNIRIAQVQREWQYLVRTVGLGIKQYKDRYPSPFILHPETEGDRADMQKTFDWTGQMIELLCELKNLLSETNQAWETFNCSDGDISFFKDLDSLNDSSHLVCLALRTIKDTFQKLKRLEQNLVRWEEFCLTLAQIVC